MEGNSNLEITIFFHSSIFGMEGKKWIGMVGNSNAGKDSSGKKEIY